MTTVKELIAKLRDLDQDEQITLGCDLEDPSEEFKITHWQDPNFSDVSFYIIEEEQWTPTK